jgi:hypothetical protein
LGLGWGDPHLARRHDGGAGVGELDRHLRRPGVDQPGAHDQLLGAEQLFGLPGGERRRLHDHHDETFKSNISSLFTANNFLYVFGDSAINVLSDVRVSGVTTLFSNVNLTANLRHHDAAHGVSVLPHVAFATQMGFYGLYGSTPQKLSDALDGIFDKIQFANTVSGGVARIYNILCAAYLFQYADPITGTTRPLLALNFNKKWFFASQGGALTLIAGGFLSGVPTLYGTNGTHIWKLFSDTSTAISWSIKTALWSLKDPIALKQTLKGGVEITARRSRRA